MFSCFDHLGEGIYLKMFVLLTNISIGRDAKMGQ